MSVNTLTFEQSATMLNAMYAEATGAQPTLQVVDTATFTTVGTALLRLGTEPTMNALSQVLARTIFSIRPYSQKLKGINVTEERWGSIVRKISYIDGAVENDQRRGLTDGTSEDHYIVKKPKVIQTNYYGGTDYQYHVTIFKDQLDIALKDATEFGRFMAGVMQNVTDHLTQIAEAEARQALINMATGITLCNPSCYINVLQEYYNETGVSLTAVTMNDDQYFVPFTKWLYGFINTLTDFMSERSYKYHANITGSEVARHTPFNKMKAYMSANMLNKIDASVLSSIFNPEKLKMIDFERINYWQNIDVPYEIQATPCYLDTSNGALIDATTPVHIENMIGMIFDEEALGTVRMSTWQAMTPLNAAGGYWNQYYHFTQKIWNSFDENCVVLYAGVVTP